MFFSVDLIILVIFEKRDSHFFVYLAIFSIGLFERENHCQIKNYYLLKTPSCLLTCQVSTFLFYQISDFDVNGFFTVFPRIVVVTTILFLGLRCDNYSRETTIQGRKLLFFRHSLGHLLWSTEASEVLELTHNHTLIPLLL